MLYNPPLGGGVNDPYIDGNPATGVEGSDVPAAAIEYTQREIINALTAAGLNPSNGDLTQLMQAIKLLGAYNAPVDGGILKYVGATQLKYVPSKADYAKVNGVLLPIPAAGVLVANTVVEVGGVAGQNLAANSTYDLYLKSTAGVLAPSFYLDAGGGTHMNDTTAGNIGTEVRSNGGVPDSTRSLIGKVRTNGAAQFQSGPGGLINWFNRRTLSTGASINGVGFSSTAIGEITTAGRASFLTWGDEAIWGICAGNRSNNPSGSSGSDVLTLYIDGTQAGSNGGGYVSGASGQGGNFVSFVNTVLTEGFHYTTLFGAVSSGSTGSISSASNVVTVRG